MIIILSSSHIKFVEAVFKIIMDPKIIIKKEIRQAA
jgi:hypothetical protein